MIIVSLYRNFCATKSSCIHRSHQLNLILIPVTLTAIVLMFDSTWWDHWVKNSSTIEELLRQIPSLSLFTAGQSQRLLKMSPAILGMSYRWVTSISWTIRPCGNSRRIYWIAVKFPWLEFCLLLWMHHLFCTGLLSFVCSGVHDMEGKGGWASDCLTWWLDLTFLWRLFSGPHDKKKAQMCCCFTSFQQVTFSWCVQKIGLWSSDDVLMFIPRSWPPRHGSHVATAFFPGQIPVFETIYHHE